MSVLIADKDLFFGTIPKVACTSLKIFLYELSTGKRWQPFEVDGRTVYIHDHVPGLRKPDYPDLSAVERWTMVRDPVKRFVSAFQDRVVAKKELELPRSKAALEAMGLPVAPDIGTFVDHFDDYCSASTSVHWHMQPQSAFIGDEPAYWDQIFSFDQIADVSDRLQNRLGQSAAMRHAQRSPTFEGGLSERHVRILKEIYSDDYRLYGAYF